MATLRIDIGPHSFSKTVSMNDLNRLEAAARTTFSLPANATNAQVAAAVAEWEWRNIKGLVKAAERSSFIQSGHAAANGVQEITLS